MKLELINQSEIHEFCVLLMLRKVQLNAKVPDVQIGHVSCSDHVQCYTPLAKCSVEHHWVNALLSCSNQQYTRSVAIYYTSLAILFCGLPPSPLPQGPLTSSIVM